MCPPEIFNPAVSGLILFYDTSISASYGGSGGTINNSSTVNIARRAKTGGILGLNYFTGDISVVKIYNKALSTNEIVASFNSIKDRYGI